MESFKEITDINRTDIRNTYFKYVNQSTGETTERTIEDIHKALSSVSLTLTVPEEIQDNFNIAKNLALYSWYCYPFHQIAEMKAYSTVERALKLKYDGCDNKSFKQLIKKAVNDGYIKDSGFKHIKSSGGVDSIEYSRTLIDTMPRLRNSLAHGDRILHPWSISTLSICSNFINQLYE